jgi:hypothetical protein
MSASFESSLIMLEAIDLFPDLLQCWQSIRNVQYSSLLLGLAIQALQNTNKLLACRGCSLNC